LASILLSISLYLIFLSAEAMLTRPKSRLWMKYYSLEAQTYCWPKMMSLTNHHFMRFQMKESKSWILKVNKTESYWINWYSLIMKHLKIHWISW
jgi:hypothetical protein